MHRSENAYVGRFEFTGKQSTLAWRIYRKSREREMTLKTDYLCSDCGRQLQQGEFIAIIGNTPPTGLSAPVGRADKILEEVGKIFCEDCFKKRYRSKST
jgi:DNA-directed RNA polymerase subunit RPC12/RpoP